MSGTGGSRTPGGTPRTAERTGDRSVTPARTRPRSRGRSIRRRDNEIVVHERTVQERVYTGGNVTWPTLTATNYVEWALVMQINMEANFIWEAVEGNPSSHANDKAALAALLKAVPPEMVGALATKGTAKSAWEAIKTMRLGTDRVRQATLQRLWKDFEQITFHANETLDAFGMRITSLVNTLRSLGDTVEEVRIVRKILRVVPRDYSQMACSIETLLDLNALSVEELIGRLRSSEGRGGARCKRHPASHGGGVGGPAKAEGARSRLGRRRPWPQEGEAQAKERQRSHRRARHV
jgi:hypothetical protein